MRLLDTRVDVANFDASPCGGPAARSAPGTGCIDDLMAFAQVGVVKRVVLNPLNHWCRSDCLQSRSVELHRHRVKRDIVLTGDLCAGCIRSQPPFEIVSYSIQLGTI
jgi:hypothetical protein